MTQATSHPPYIAEVRGSHEVTVFGHASAEFWAEKLADEGLFLYRDDAKAKVMIGAVASRWMGLAFSELMIGVATACDPNGETPNGLFLVSAYNTSRIFTFCERFVFKTPYAHGRIVIDRGDACGFRLLRRGVEIIRLGREAREPDRVHIEDWKVPIFLPRRLAGKSPVGKVYFARLQGETEVAAFNRDVDVAKIETNPDDPTLAWLIESGFQPAEWHVRREAVHARSKTYARDKSVWSS